MFFFNKIKRKRYKFLLIYNRRRKKRKVRKKNKSGGKKGIIIGLNDSQRTSRLIGNFISITLYPPLLSSSRVPLYSSSTLQRRSSSSNRRERERERSKRRKEVFTLVLKGSWYRDSGTIDLAVVCFSRCGSRRGCHLPRKGATVRTNKQDVHFIYIYIQLRHKSTN